MPCDVDFPGSEWQWHWTSGDDYRKGRLQGEARIERLCFKVLAAKRRPWMTMFLPGRCFQPDTNSKTVKSLAWG